MGDIDRRPRNDAAALNVHVHVCPECAREYSCNCSAQDRHETLVCVDCERKGS